MFVGLYSCEKEIEYDGNEEPDKLVVNSIFDNKNAWEMRVTKTRGIMGKDDIMPIKDATVEIRNEKNNNLEGTFTYNSIQKKYLTTYKPELSKKYKLVVKHKSYKELTSTSSIPDSVNYSIKSIKTINDIQGELLDINIVIQDTPKVKNYYVLKVRLDRYYTKTNSAFINDELKGQFDGSQFLPFYVQNLYKDNDVLEREDDYFNRYLFQFFDDTHFDGEKKSINLIMDLIYDQPSHDLRFYVELISINHDLYQYYKTVQIYFDSKDSPFSQPVQIFNNIENGLGIFSGQYINEEEFIVKDFKPF
jgi:hypothetical protein